MRKKIEIKGVNIPLIYDCDVDLISYNVLEPQAIEKHFENVGTPLGLINDHLGQFDIRKDMQLVTEIAARTCYQSWTKGRPHKEHIQHLASVKHFSTFEHNVLVFMIAGISRSLSHELVRHRHLQFSQLSQRYVDHSDPQYNIGFVVPPDLIDLFKVEPDREKLFANQCFYSLHDYMNELKILEVDMKGSDVKHRRQIARAKLPHCIETRMVVSGNARSWFEACIKRCSEAADVEIRRMMTKVLIKLNELFPDMIKGSGIGWKVMVDGSYAIYGG